MDETNVIAEVAEMIQDGRDTQRDKYVTFRSGGEHFGLKIEYVNEIIVSPEITPIPESADYIKGLINLRGKIIPVIDVRLRFGQEPFEYNDRTCTIVINYKSTVVGLVVEKIAEVVEIQTSNILTSPSVSKGDKTQNKYVYAIGKVGDQVKLLLDPDKLLNDEELSAIEQTGDGIGETEEEE